MEILKLKKINATATEVLFFKKDVDIGKVLVPNKISSGEKKNNKYFIGYDGQIKWMYCFDWKDDLLEKYTISDKVSADTRK